MVGELRALPVRVPAPACEFRFRLKNTHRIEQLKVNEKLVTPSPNGEYHVKLHATSSAKPVPLVKYVAATRWRPVPVFVDVSVLPPPPGSDAARPDAEQRGILQAVVQTSPQLKSSLQNVALSTRLPPGVSVGPEEALLPVGSCWHADAGELQWKLGPELVRDVPITCTASVVGEAGDEGLGVGTGAGTPAALQGALSTVPFQLQFGCEGVTISGIELEVQLGVGASDGTPGSSPASARSAAPIGRLKRRFGAGEYKVLPGQPSDTPGRASGERAGEESPTARECSGSPSSSSDARSGLSSGPPLLG